VAELQRSIELSPNFALAHYTLAFVQAQAGDARAAVEAADHSRRLSPFDPMLFGMLGARAIALVRLGRFEEAAEAAAKAAARPNAFPHILALAAYTAALAGSLADARIHAAAMHGKVPRYGITDFLRAFQLDAEGAALFRRGARRLGGG
jgi:Flp pilus assembly protein TadD